MSAEKSLSAVKERVSTPVRRIGKTLLIYGLGEFLVRAISVITLPLYTRIFTTYDYGNVSLVVSVATVMTIIAQLGSETTIARFHASAEHLQDERSVSKTILVSMAVYSSVVALAAAAALAVHYAGQDAPIAKPLLISILTVPITILNRLLGQILRNRMLSALYAVTNCAYAVVNIGVALLLILGFGFGIEAIFIALAIADVTVVVVRAFILRDVWLGTFSPQLLPALLRFGLPLMPFAICYWIYTSADRVIINHFYSSHEAGLFSTATSLASVMTMILTVVTLAWTPYVLKVAREDRAAVGGVVSFMTSATLVVFGSLTVALSAVPDLLALVVGAEFRSATGIVPPLLVAGYFTALTQIVGTGLLIANRTHYFALHGIIAAVAHVGLSLTLVPRYGIHGAALAAVVSQGYVLVAIGFAGQRFERVAYDIRGLVLASMVVVASALFDYISPSYAVLPARVAVALLEILAMVALLAPSLLSSSPVKARMENWTAARRQA
jgi:O-antigen/teichoic acid export membrane protein